MVDVKVQKLMEIVSQMDEEQIRKFTLYARELLQSPEDCLIDRD